MDGVQVRSCPAMTTSVPGIPAHESYNTNGDHPLRKLCTAVHDRIEAFLQEDVPTERLRKVQAQTRISLGIIQEALDRYRSIVPTTPFHRYADTPPPSHSSLSLSYNGGKDCLVLLIIYLAALSTHPHLPPSLESIYIVPPNPFPEVETFVDQSSTTYHLSLTRLARASMKAAFEDYLAEKKEVKAIFVGTRRTDPHGGSLTSFDATDHGWPPFIRVHPVIDWHYVEVWSVRDPGKPLHPVVE